MMNLDNAFARIDRINNSATPCVLAARYARFLFRTAAAGDRGIYWLASAIRCHGQALAYEGINAEEMAFQTVKRDRCLQLAARYASPSHA